MSTRPTHAGRVSDFGSWAWRIIGWRNTAMKFGIGIRCATHAMLAATGAKELETEVRPIASLREFVGRLGRLDHAREIPARVSLDLEANLPVKRGCLPAAGSRGVPRSWAAGLLGTCMGPGPNNTRRHT